MWHGSGLIRMWATRGRVAERLASKMRGGFERDLQREPRRTHTLGPRKQARARASRATERETGRAHRGIGRLLGECPAQLVFRWREIGGRVPGRRWTSAGKPRTLRQEWVWTTFMRQWYTEEELQLGRKRGTLLCRESRAHPSASRAPHPPEAAESSRRPAPVELRSLSFGRVEACGLGAPRVFSRTHVREGSATACTIRRHRGARHAPLQPAVAALASTSRPGLRASCFPRAGPGARAPGVEVGPHAGRLLHGHRATRPGIYPSLPCLRRRSPLLQHGRNVAKVVSVLRRGG